MRFFAVALIFFGVTASSAQTPEVPHKMHFAGMTLTIRDDARREIQKDVDALTKNQKYFNVKVERAKTYFPIIEKVFAEERLPDDFKYLVLQESALVPDAVSVSDAVGFWQFKDYTAREMGLRVDGQIDERMNIVSASRGAAKYLKQSNFYFNNWIYALQAYQMGAGGVQRSIGEEDHGVSRMEITSDTYWYVKKYLSYKVAFEDALKGDAQVKVKEYPIQYATSVRELSSQMSVDEKVIRDFNRWIKGDQIPNDKSYSLIVPSGLVTEDFDKLTLASSHTAAAKAQPKLSEPLKNEPAKIKDERKEINGSWAARAVEGESLVSLAARLKMSVSDLVRFNDVAIDHQPIAGLFYFVEKKKSKGYEQAYTARPGDDLWLISQLQGVQLKKLKKYNADAQAIAPGTVVWLASVKGSDHDTEVVELEEQDTFDWSVKADHPKTGPQQDEKVNEIPKQSIDKTVKESQEQSQPKDESNGQLIIHEVKPSDTLFSVARQYNVTIKDLMDWNSKVDFALAVGEKLKIKAR